MRRLMQISRIPALILGSMIVLAFLGIAFAAPLLATPEGDSPYQIPRDGIGLLPQPPAPGHPLGTLANQYDVYYGIIWGTRMAFRFSLITVFFRVLIGGTIGLLAGYYRGRVDNLLMRITDAFLSFPILIILLVILALFGRPWYFSVMEQTVFYPSIDTETLVIISLILFGWMPYARLIRGNILAERESEYVEAAVSIGANDARIMFKHLLPNSLGGLFAVLSADIGGVVVLMATLNFLGFSSNPGEVPAANWGEMLKTARNWIVGSPGNPFAFWYTYVPPAAAIVLYSIGWNLIGDGMRSVLDPRMKGHHLQS